MKYMYIYQHPRKPGKRGDGGCNITTPFHFWDQNILLNAYNIVLDNWMIHISSKVFSISVCQRQEVWLHFVIRGGRGWNSSKMVDSSQTNSFRGKFETDKILLGGRVGLSPSPCISLHCNRQTVNTLIKCMYWVRCLQLYRVDLEVAIPVWTPEDDVYQIALPQQGAWIKRMFIEFVYVCVCVRERERERERKHRERIRERESERKKHRYI